MGAPERHGNGRLDINSPINKGGDIAICLASRAGHVNVVTWLLKCGADINQPDREGNTALHFASRAGHVNVVELLLSYSYDKAAPHPKKGTVGKVLQKYGADVNRRNKKKQTALDCAKKHSHSDVVALFKGHPAQKETANVSGSVFHSEFWDPPPPPQQAADSNQQSGKSCLVHLTRQGSGSGSVK